MSIRSLVRVASAGLAALVLACTTARKPALSDAVRELTSRSEEANDALLRGDVDRYRELIPIAQDFTLMSPFGGTPTRGADEKRMNAMRSFFENGSLKQELVHAYATPDMIVLATIERARVEVGGLPAQDWALRVTLVYRREGNEWRLVHRHADPLSHGINLEHAAALGRGEARR
jgi:ketosteroid isomerase-like protein